MNKPCSHAHFTCHQPITHFNSSQDITQHFIAYHYIAYIVTSRTSSYIIAYRISLQHCISFIILDRTSFHIIFRIKLYIYIISYHLSSHVIYRCKSSIISYHISSHIIPSIKHTQHLISVRIIRVAFQAFICIYIAHITSRIIPNTHKQTRYHLGSYYMKTMFLLNPQRVKVVYLTLVLLNNELCMPYSACLVLPTTYNVYRIVL